MFGSDPRCSQCGAKLRDLDRDDCPRCGHVLDFAEMMAGVLPCLWCREPCASGNPICPNCGRMDPHATRRQSLVPLLLLSLGRMLARLVTDPHWRRAILFIAIAFVGWLIFR